MSKSQDPTKIDTDLERKRKRELKKQVGQGKLPLSEFLQKVRDLKDLGRAKTGQDDATGGGSGSKTGKTGGDKSTDATQDDTTDEERDIEREERIIEDDGKRREVIVEEPEPPDDDGPSEPPSGGDQPSGGGNQPSGGGQRSGGDRSTGGGRTGGGQQNNNQQQGGGGTVTTPPSPGGQGSDDGQPIGTPTPPDQGSDGGNVSTPAPPSDDQDSTPPSDDSTDARSGSGSSRQAGGGGGSNQSGQGANQSESGSNRSSGGQSDSGGSASPFAGIDVKGADRDIAVSKKRNVFQDLQQRTDFKLEPTQATFRVKNGKLTASVPQPVLNNQRRENIEQNLEQQFNVNLTDRLIQFQTNDSGAVTGGEIKSKVLNPRRKQSIIRDLERQRGVDLTGKDVTFQTNKQGLVTGGTVKQRFLNTQRRKDIERQLERQFGRELSDEQIDFTRNDKGLITGGQLGTGIATIERGQQLSKQKQSIERDLEQQLGVELTDKQINFSTNDKGVLTGKPTDKFLKQRAIKQTLAGTDDFTRSDIKQIQVPDEFDSAAPGLALDFKKSARIREAKEQRLAQLAKPKDAPPVDQLDESVEETFAKSAPLEPGDLSVEFNREGNISDVAIRPSPRKQLAKQRAVDDFKRADEPTDLQATITDDGVKTRLDRSAINQEIINQQKDQFEGLQGDRLDVLRGKQNTTIVQPATLDAAFDRLQTAFQRERKRAPGNTKLFTENVRQALDGSKDDIKELFGGEDVFDPSDPETQDIIADIREELAPGQEPSGRIKDALKDISRFTSAAQKRKFTFGERTPAETRVVEPDFNREAGDNFQQSRPISDVRRGLEKFNRQLDIAAAKQRAEDTAVKTSDIAETGGDITATIRPDAEQGGIDQSDFTVTTERRAFVEEVEESLASKTPLDRQEIKVNEQTAGGETTFEPVPVAGELTEAQLAATQTDKSVESLSEDRQQRLAAQALATKEGISTERTNGIVTPVGKDGTPISFSSDRAKSIATELVGATESVPAEFEPETTPGSETVQPSSQPGPITPESEPGTSVEHLETVGIGGQQSNAAKAVAKDRV